MPWYLVFLLLLLALFLFQVSDYVWAGGLIVIVVVASLIADFLSKAGKVGRAVGRGLKADMAREWQDAENTKPNPPKGKDIDAMAGDMGKRLSEEMVTEQHVFGGPESNEYKERQGNVMDWLGRGSKGVLDGIQKLMGKKF
ncbi:MAG: hypothetical protein ABH854_02415 [Candidatus Diapherotrites archaeon]